MIKTAIVEDEDEAFETLKGFLLKFGEDNNFLFSITHYKEGLSFLDESKNFDLIFMDIEMPHMNGMEVAKKLREKDRNVPLIFITNLVQYAIQGYQVDAIDYVLKPIQYARFESLMIKTMKIVGSNKDQEIILKTTGGAKKVSLSSILYVEIKDHLLIYYLDNEEEVEVWGTLANAKASLPDDMFSRCSNSVIINIQKVTSIDKDKAYLTNRKIPISFSRNKKKDVLNKLNEKKVSLS